MLLPPARKARARGRAPDCDAGVLLLDVLIGIALAALVLVTASQTIGTLRQRAHLLQVQSDVNHLAERLQLYRLETDGRLPPAVLDTTSGPVGANLYPDTDGAATVASARDQSPVDVHLTKGVLIHRYYDGLNSGQDFGLCLIHATGTTVHGWAYWDSRVGAVAASGRGAPTGSTPCLTGTV